jgi:hypothetical protein
MPQSMDDGAEPENATTPLPSGRDLIGAVLGGDVLDATKHDQELVALVHEHLGGVQVHSRAGHNLPAAIEQLAISRAKAEVTQ